MKSKKLFKIIAACILLAVMILLIFTRLFDIQSPDENIDYRRVRNLQVYFKNNTNIVVTSKCIHEGDYNLEFEIEDYAASTENIMLAITAMGYAGVWMDGMMKFEGNIDKVRKLLNINCEETPRKIIPFGKPKSMVIQKEKKHFLKEFILFSGS